MVCQLLQKQVKSSKECIVLFFVNFTEHNEESQQRKYRKEEIKREELGQAGVCTKRWRGVCGGEN